MEPIRLLLIDDHTLFREGLARLLDAESGLEVAGHFSSTVEAFESVNLRSVQVVLLDFDLGAAQGMRFFEDAAGRGFTGKVLMVTAGMPDADAARALESGASGIFLKINPPTSLVSAIHKVASGEPWPDAATYHRMIAAAARKTKPPAPSPLTQREREVLKGVFEGLANKEIAADLEISESYVKAVLQQLFDKTGVRTRSQLVRVALEKHLE